MSGRRLLVISYHFGSGGAIGGLRWLGFTKYLRRLGWTAAVLTAAEHEGDARDTGATVERCPRFWTSLDVLRSARRLMIGRAPRSAAPSAGTAASHHTSPLHQLGRELAAWLAFPDEGRGWIVRAALRARAMIRRFRPDVVVSSGPPHSAHVVAGLALAGRSARWVIDLRDPWAGPFPAIWQSHRLLGSRTYGTLSRRLEAAAVGAADAVLTTTPQLAAVLRAQYPGARVVCVPNGVDHTSLPAPPSDPYPGLAIAYAGTLYAGRDIGAVAGGLRRFLERHPEAARAGSKLRVAGNAESQHAKAFVEAVTAAGMGQAVEMMGTLPREEALRLLARSRVALVLAQQQELQIPAKLYETLAMGVPTLVVAPEGSATAVEGRRLGAFVHDSDDVEGVAALFERLWRDGLEPRPGPTGITYEALAPRMDALLRSDLTTALQAAPHSSGGEVKGAKR